VLYSAISAAGGAGATGRTTTAATAGVPGSSGSVTIGLAGLSVQKTSSVVLDTISATNPKAIPGATIRYCILVTNIWSLAATNVVANDPLPSQTTFVAGSLRSGTTCANATTTPAAGASISGSTVNATIASLAAGASYALAFNVTVN